MTKDLALYLAGLFDGEGCVYISKSRKTQYNLVVSISNNDLHLLKLIHSKLGGAIRLEKSKGRRCGEWYSHGDIAINFLKRIHPFSFIKDRQIALALEFYAWNKQHLFNRGWKKKPIPFAILQKREEYYKQLQQLKQEVTEYEGNSEVV